jgi:hypothetical protein
VSVDDYFFECVVLCYYKSGAALHCYYLQIEIIIGCITDRFTFIHSKRRTSRNWGCYEQEQEGVFPLVPQTGTIIIAITYFSTSNPSVFFQHRCFRHFMFLTPPPMIASLSFSIYIHIFFRAYLLTVTTTSTAPENDEQAKGCIHPAREHGRRVCAEPHQEESAV